jgi:hypothetical protein
MPIPPDIEVFDPNNPDLTLENIHYNAPTSFMANLHLGWLGNTFRNLYQASVANPNLGQLKYFDYVPEVQNFIEEVKNRPLATPDEIQTAERERPGFKVPEGATKEVLEMMQGTWDDQQYYNFIANQPGSKIATLSGFLGGGAAGFADPAALAAGGAVGRIAGRAIEPLATKLMTKLAVSETMGSQVAQIATLAGKSAVHGAGGFAGFQGAQEVGEQVKNIAFNEPSSWIESLQRVGTSAGYGALLFGAGRGLGASLVGYKRPVLAFANHLPPEVVGEEKVGGLFQSDAFKDLSARTKALIGRVYKPWTQEADIAAREDSIAQAFNGNEPKVDIILKQGAIDEGPRFKRILQENEIDADDLDQRLSRANIEADNALAELAKVRYELQGKDKKLIPKKDFSDEAKISQPALLEKIKKSKFKFLPDNLPENLAKRINEEKKINKLIAKGAPKEAIEKKRLKLTKLLPPRKELMKIKRKLIDKGLPEKVEEFPEFKRLVDLSKHWPQAKNMIDRLQLELEHKTRAQDLLGQKVLIESMQNHINDAHEPVSNIDKQEYVDHLRNPMDPEIEYELPPPEDITVDEVLKEIPSDEIQALVDNTSHPDIARDLQNVMNDIRKMPKFKHFSKDLVTCLLRNK